MSEKMRIGVDIDGVLADFNSAYIDLCIAVAGADYFPPRPFDIPTWNYPEFYSYTDAEVSRVWRAIEDDASFWRDLKAYDDAREALGKLALLELGNADVYFVTSRPGQTAKEQTEAWLRMHGWDRATVLISSAKGAVAKALKLTHYVDDRDLNCVDVRDTSPSTAVYVVDRPWNRNLQATDIRRVPNAVDFTRELLAIAVPA